LKTYYELLQVAPNASANQIKQAFRQIIARYHPDKVQHLGAEFQELAQVRSAELTTAYKTLIDATRRAEYDQSLNGSAVAARDPADAAARPVAPPPPAPPPPPLEDDAEAPDLRFESLQSGCDSVLRRAALARVDTLFQGAFAASERLPVPGFDLSYLSKPRLFDRGQARPWLLAKFVPRIDKRTLQRVRAEVARANAVKKAAVSVFLLTGEIRSETEIAEAIGAQQPGHPIVIVPVDVRDWHALVPKGADQTVRALADRLRTA
jgi:DnaJ-domain-containing protein 1